MSFAAECRSALRYTIGVRHARRIWADPAKHAAWPVVAFWTAVFGGGLFSFIFWMLTNRGPGWTLFGYASYSIFYFIYVGDKVASGRLSRMPMVHEPLLYLLLPWPLLLIRLAQTSLQYLDIIDKGDK